MSREGKIRLYASRLATGLCPRCGSKQDTHLKLCSKCRTYAIKKRDRERQSQTSKLYHWNLRLAVIALFGNQCVRCGFTDPRALQFDHKHGGGKQALRSDKYYYGFLKDMLTHPDFETFQLLCANCNWIKRYERNENPNVKSFTVAPAA